MGVRNLKVYSNEHSVKPKHPLQKMILSKIIPHSIISCKSIHRGNMCWWLEELCMCDWWCNCLDWWEEHVCLVYLLHWGVLFGLEPGRVTSCLKKHIIFMHGWIFSGCSVFWEQKVVFADSISLLMESLKINRCRLMKPQSTWFLSAAAIMQTVGEMRSFRALLTALRHSFSSREN